MSYYQGPTPPLTDEAKELRDAFVHMLNADRLPTTREKAGIGVDAIAQLIADYDRLLARHHDAVRAADALADVTGQLISQARAHRIPDHPVTDSAERALKTWRSAR